MLNNTSENLFCCDGCHRQIGTITIVDDQEILEVAGTVVYSYHGRCITCNTQVHWHMSDKKLERLLRNRSVLLAQNRVNGV